MMNGANEMATTLTSANETRTKPTSTPHHWCAECALGFRKLKTLEQHRAGKRHRAVVAERDSVFDQFRREAPLWAVGAEPADVVTGWSPAELSAVFPMRATCLDKHAQTDILRGDFGFRGMIVSDCDAIADAWQVMTDD